MVRQGVNIWEVKKITEALAKGATPGELAKAFNTTPEIIQGFAPEKVAVAGQQKEEREIAVAKKKAVVKAAADVAAATAAKLAQDSFE